MTRFLVLIVAIAACIGLIFVTQKKRKRQYSLEQESPPVALNPVFGIENEENPYDVIGVPLKEED